MIPEGLIIGTIIVLCALIGVGVGVIALGVLELYNMINGLDDYD